MTKLTILLTCFILSSSIIVAQKTPEELGQITFNCFQQHQLDSFFKLKPTIADLTEFGKNLGIDTTSAQYKDFLHRYPLVVQSFKDKCKELLEDTAQLGFSWTSAKIDTIKHSSKTLPLDNRYPNSQTTTITTIDIYMISNNKRFKLSLGDVTTYSGIWKPGNNIEITEL